MRSVMVGFRESIPSSAEAIVAGFRRKYLIGTLTSPIYLFGFMVSLLSGIVDVLWKMDSLIIGDVVIGIGCAASWMMVHSKNEKLQAICWWPAYGGAWAAFFPTTMATGGLHSPFIGSYLPL